MSEVSLCGCGNHDALGGRPPKCFSNSIDVPLGSERADAQATRASGVEGPEGSMCLWSAVQTRSGKDPIALFQPAGQRRR